MSLDDLASDRVLRYNTLMEDFIAIVFDWIGENEGVLSGTVAIAVLIGLVATGVHRLILRSQTKLVAPSEKSVDVPEIELNEPAIDQEIRYCRTSAGVRIAYAVTDFLIDGDFEFCQSKQLY